MAKKPWDRENPRSSSSQKHKQLSSAEKKKAKGRAQRAGRSYPNLVDNMAVARQKPEPQRKKKGGKRKGSGSKRKS